MSDQDDFAKLAVEAEGLLGTASTEPLGSEDQACAMDELSEVVNRMLRLTDAHYT